MDAEHDPSNGTPKWWPFVRDAASFGLGMFIALFELLAGRGVPERPYMMVLAAALLGFGPIMKKFGGA